MHTILLYYKYTRIEDPVALRESQYELLSQLGMTGRVLVSEEGINGTCEGTVDAAEKYIEAMKQDPRFADIHWKKSQGNGKSFPRLSVKVRKEIVALGQPVDPTVTTGKRLTPEALHQWLEADEDIVIVDMRNDYEHAVGHFEGSVLPPMHHFRELPAVVDTITPYKNKKVVTVCTGGIRCEKASGYLLQQGFDDVYQLDGGIVSYMEKYPGKHFKGSLYVFDNRNTMHFNAAMHQPIGTCAHCGAPTESYRDCITPTCNAHHLACELCINELGQAYCPSCICQKTTTTS